MIASTPSVLSPQSSVLTLDHLTRLADFQCHANVGLFVAIFGHATGPHLWNKFQAYDENLLFIVNQMDNQTAQKLLDYLNQPG